MAKRRTNLYLDEADRKNADRIAQHYGLDTMVAAVRFALAETARRVPGNTDSHIDSHGEGIAPSGTPGIAHQDGN